MTLLTRAEATRYEETSRHADVMAFVAEKVPVTDVLPVKAAPDRSARPVQGCW